MAGKGRITIKVFAGFMLLLLAVAISLFLINNSLKRHSSLVSTINDPNAFITTWENTLSALEQSGADMNQYSAANDSLFLEAFEDDREAVNTGLDTLYTLSGKKEGRKAFVDSLVILIDRRMELYTAHAYLFLENKNMGSFDNAIKRFAEREEEAKDVQKPAEQPKQVEPAKPAKSNFWQRLFSKKEKKKTQPAPDTATTRISTQVLKKSDLPKVIDELRRTEKQAKEETIKNMLSLVADEQNLDNEIYKLTRQMEQAEIQATRTQVIDTSADLKYSTQRIMIILSVVGIIFILLFTFLISRDVRRDTQIQLELEQARKKAVELAKARQDFASSMSHEIRTPLNALVGFSEQLSKSELMPGQEKMVDALLRSSHHLMSVINPVLDYGKLSSGKAEIETATFDINDVLNDTCLLFEQQAKDKNLHLNIDSLHHTFNRVEGDEVKLKQVVFNLVSNAIKFTQQGSVTVSCQPLDNIGGKKIYRFAIKDTGIGIPQDKIGLIFDEFTQADSSITRQFGGTGLGLNIVKRLVELQGGTISVTSHQDQGSTFVFELPYVVSNSTVETTEAEELPTNALVGKTIMVCDDEEMNRMLLEHILAKFGANIIETSSPFEMLEKVESGTIDLLLLDLHMPGMSGTDALKTIRGNANPKVAKMPVIVVTGDVREEEKQKTIAAGINGYLSKPFVEAQLLRIILATFNS